MPSVRKKKDPNAGPIAVGEYLGQRAGSMDGALVKTAKDLKKLRRQIRMLGVSRLDALEKMRRQQHELLRRLPSKLRRTSGLRNCDGNCCGRAECIEACFFASWRQRLEKIEAAYGLLKWCQRPLFELRVSWSAWERPFGGLRDVSIAAAKQLNCRALEGLNKSDIVAIGSFKVLADPIMKWVCEIHVIIAGAKMRSYRRCF